MRAGTSARANLLPVWSGTYDCCPLCPSLGPGTASSAGLSYPMESRVWRQGVGSCGQVQGFTDHLRQQLLSLLGPQFQGLWYGTVHTHIYTHGAILCMQDSL